jgi:hypothetical protein
MLSWENNVVSSFYRINSKLQDSRNVLLQSNTFIEMIPECPLGSKVIYFVAGLWKPAILLRHFKHGNKVELTKTGLGHSKRRISLNLSHVLIYIEKFHEPVKPIHPLITEPLTVPEEPIHPLIFEPLTVPEEPLSIIFEPLTVPEEPIHPLITFPEEPIHPLITFPEEPIHPLITFPEEPIHPLSTEPLIVPEEPIHPFITFPEEPIHPFITEPLTVPEVLETYKQRRPKTYKKRCPNTYEESRLKVPNKSPEYNTYGRIFGEVFSPFQQYMIQDMVHSLCVFLTWNDYYLWFDSKYIQPSHILHDPVYDIFIFNTVNDVFHFLMYIRHTFSSEWILFGGRY